MFIEIIEKFAEGNAPTYWW